MFLLLPESDIATKTQHRSHNQNHAESATTRSTLISQPLDTITATTHPTTTATPSEPTQNQTHSKTPPQPTNPKPTPTQIKTPHPYHQTTSKTTTQSRSTHTTNHHKPKSTPPSHIKKCSYRTNFWTVFGKRSWCSCVFAKRNSKSVYRRVFVNAA